MKPAKKKKVVLVKAAVKAPVFSDVLSNVSNLDFLDGTASTPDFVRSPPESISDVSVDDGTNKKKEVLATTAPSRSSQRKKNHKKKAAKRAR